MPPPSSTWDCDDDALYMYNQLKEARNWSAIMPVIGNLEISGESFLDLEYNHVWIMVNEVVPYVKSGSDPVSINDLGICHVWVAYDWGEPCFDLQHYEGAIITPNELIEAVEYDKQ